MLFSLPFQENGLLVFNQFSIEIDLDLGLHVRYSLVRSSLTQLQQLNLLVELIVVGVQTRDGGRSNGQISHIAYLFQDRIGLDVLHLVGSLYRRQGEDGVGMVSQLIDGITAVQLTEQILADLGILGIGIDAHALRSCDAEGSIIVLGYREYGKAYISSELLGGLVHSTGYIGSRVQRTIVSKSSTVTYHGVDGIPGALSQVLGSDLGGVGIVIDLLEEALQAFAVEYQLAFVVVVLAAQGTEYIQEVAAGTGTMGQAPGSGTLVLYFLAEIQELLPGELTICHLGGQSFDLLVQPISFRADLL